MAEEENMTLALRAHLEVMNQGMLDVADEIFDRDVVWHSSLVPPEAQRGPEGFLTVVATYSNGGAPQFGGDYVQGTGII